MSNGFIPSLCVFLFVLRPNELRRPNKSKSLFMSLLSLLVLETLGWTDFVCHIFVNILPVGTGIRPADIFPLALLSVTFKRTLLVLTVFFLLLLMIFKPSSLLSLVILKTLGLPEFPRNIFVNILLVGIRVCPADILPVILLFVTFKFTLLVLTVFFLLLFFKSSSLLSLVILKTLGLPEFSRNIFVNISPVGIRVCPADILPVIFLSIRFKRTLLVLTMFFLFMFILLFTFLLFSSFSFLLMASS